MDSTDEWLAKDQQRILLIYDCNLCSPMQQEGNCNSVEMCFAGKSRGYAFIEFEHKQDMKTAYKLADGKKIEGKRVIVDVERGRTVPNW